MNDTKSKPVPQNAMPQHKGLAAGKSSDTGAGKGASQGKERPSTRW